jgi:hypothetical protein
MDICRSLLLIGFVVLLWKLEFHRIRVVRDFVLWGINYPFHFTLIAVLIFMIWGLIGEKFGLQGLFLENDGPTQILLGGGLMLLFATLILHYSVLDAPGRWWNNSLKSLIGVMRTLNRLMPTEYPVQRILRNGFLNKLDHQEIEAIYQLAFHGKTDVAPVDSNNSQIGGRIVDMLRDEPFRLLISPAILFINGFMLVVLAGVIPALVVPLVTGDSVVFRERLPWLVGVIIGYLLGVELACVTSRWAAHAAGWEGIEHQFLESLRSWTDSAARPMKVPASNEEPTRIISSEERIAHAHKHQSGEVPSSNRSRRARWVSFLLAFFVLHFMVNVILPEGLTSRWIDWPENTYIEVRSNDRHFLPSINPWSQFPWLPILILVSEAIGATVILLFWRVVRRSERFSNLRVTFDGFKARFKNLIRDAFDTLSVVRARRILIACLAVLSILSIATASWVTPLPVRSIWNGVWGTLFLGSFLALWIAAFRLSTNPAGNDREHRLTPLSIEGAILVILVMLYLAGVARWLVIALTAIVVLFLISLTLRRAAFKGQNVLVVWLCFWATVLGSLGGTILAVHLTKDTAVAAALWISLAIMIIGASELREVARRRPTLLYPLTLILAFTTFAVTYNALDERWQSAMPAAGSIACMVGLLGSAYTIIAFRWPRITLLAAVAIITVIFVLNGNAWFVAPNQFKATFPNMESYYSLPVYLNSRDYFRDTTPSAVQLRDRKVTSDVDRMEKQEESQRLATAFFEMLDQRPLPNGGYALRVLVEDPRSRLRAGVGDEMHIVGEEWFTTLLDGEDCIILAEEPFYRKIYRWFRYERLQMVQDGIVRGGSRPMRPVVNSNDPGQTGGGDNVSIRYEPWEGEGDLLGFRLRKLAPSYQKAKADYLLISMYWSGRVASVTHSSNLDRYEVEFTIPPGYPPLDDEQRQTMSTWLERCHLDAVRPISVVKRDIETTPPSLKLPDIPSSKPGDCLVLEEARDEAPVPIGIYLVGDPLEKGRDSRFASYWPTRENLSQKMEQLPASTMNDQNPQMQIKSPEYTLRVPNDRGVFACHCQRVKRTPPDNPEGVPRPIRVAIYNHCRVRPSDRMMLSWNGHRQSNEQGEAKNGQIFEVKEINDDSDAPLESLPKGYRWVTLEPVSERAIKGTLSQSMRGVENGDLLIGEWKLLEPLNNAEVLLSWKRLVGDLWTRKKPKLVIVTVSGGGIRASVWTSVVLQKLEQTLGADFPYHIRLVTGASGGMVGASYYVTSLGSPTSEILKGGEAEFSALHGMKGSELVDRMAANQLDAVAGYMVFADLISPLNPFLQRGDRGRTLEQTWIRWTGGESLSPLSRPLQDYAVDEYLGWRPSMVYTPMMVEDGRRLLISNLDLAFATRNVAGLLIEPSSRMIERPAFQGDDLDRTIHDEDDVLSLSSVEFFRLFSDSHDFRVTTAARMSASFPWVSPAISLPTSPPRRVVDAGYYDNYGVNLAALWLSKMRYWVEANTSGVVVIQIRDYVSQDARTEIDFDRLTVTSALDRMLWNAGSKVLSPGVEAISTPLLGISNARQWAMSFRNDEQVDLLDLLFDGENSRDFFRTVVFECPVEVSLNWQLSSREKEVLACGFGHIDADPSEELARTRDYLVGRDSYEFHKWVTAHRNDSNFQTALKDKYAEQLRYLGVRNTDHMSVHECRQLYENIMMNLKRMELLRDWWRIGHQPTARNSQIKTTAGDK